ncbi:tetratricopeptide repeat protein [uncultured Winogradskyella sp.]|uniref:tetratricopeptide repeat protein n=1 Tax=uncultured Winogradskyella sp. TaxID=395353 RepID=UPI00262C3502|nr:tetratricopeptide repeat protein [uncultured Winogradskyella sp.]
MREKCFFFILLVQVSISTAQQNQKKIDSLLSQIESTKIDTIKASNYIELAEIYRFKQPKKTLDYARKALKLYQNSKNNKGQSQAFFYQSSYYNSIGRIDSAKYYTKKNIEQLWLANDTLNASSQTSNLAYFELASGNTDKAITMLDSLAPIFEKFSDTSRLARIYVVKSQAYNFKGYSNLSVDANQKALNLYKTLKDSVNIAQSLMLIGDAYQGNGKQNEAIEAFEEALDIYKTLDNKIFIAQAQSYIGDSYLNLGEYNKAERYLSDALILSKELNFNSNIARSYLNLGRLKLNQKQYDNAITHFNEGQELYESLSIPHNETRAKFYLGQAYFEKGDYTKAIALLDESITISEKINDIQRLTDALHYKSLALDKTGKAEEALSVFKRNKRLNDSLFNIENKQKTEELQIVYETEKKEQEIALQENEIDLLEERAKVSTLQKWLLSSGLTLSLIALGFGFYGFRQKMKRNGLEKEKVDAELEFKKKELTTHALQLAKKNEVLEKLKVKAEALKLDSDSKNGYQQLIHTINFDLQDDKNWESFTSYFEQAYQGFNEKIKVRYPEINTNDLRLIALLKMNLSNKELASILNISPDGIKKARYRLRKKLNLSTEDSLEDTIINI